MQHEPDIRSKVLEKIDHGGIHKHSRIYFAIRVAILIALSIIALALAVFVLSFAIFSVHESGEQFLLGFGARGVATFLALFPWTALAVEVILLVLIELLFRRFTFGYRIPVLRALIGLFVCAAVGGIVVYLTPLHATLLRLAEQNELPVLGEWYEAIYASHAKSGVFRGTIGSIQGNQFVIFHNDGDHDADDGTWTVIAPANFDMTLLKLGERVYVAGSPVQLGVVRAYGIQELSRDM